MAAISSRMALHYFPSASSARHFHFSEIASFSCLASQQMDVLDKLQIIMPVQGEKERRGRDCGAIQTFQLARSWTCGTIVFFSLLCVCVNAFLCVHYTSLVQSLGCKFYYWYIHTSLSGMWRDPVARDPTGLARTWRYPRKVLCNVYIRAAQLIFKNSLQLSLLKTVFHV